MTQAAPVIPWDDHPEIGQCWLCDGLAFWRCDTCNRWVCRDHTTVEAQHWDTYGLDGVDIYCPAHRALNPATRPLAPG